MVHRRTVKALLLLFTALLLVPALSAMKVKTKADPNADLLKYKTFSWYPPRVLGSKGVIESDDHWIPLIKGVVREQLLAKGLQEVSEAGDMMVAVYGLRSATAQLEAILYPGGVNWGLGPPTTTVGRYNFAGTLAVNLTDTKTKKSIWIGVARDSLKSDLSDADDKARKAAKKMFSKYPKLP
jgi:hypothetical protein